MSSPLIRAPGVRPKPPLWRYLLIDADGRRIGRFETERIGWAAGHVFELDGERWRISEILPEVSTMVTYNAVWVVAPAP
jgi:hypothetical protein